MALDTESSIGKTKWREFHYAVTVSKLLSLVYLKISGINTNSFLTSKLEL